MSALFLGMVLALEYDCIRIFRRVIRHKNIWVMSAEDILYWIYAAVTVFCMTYEVNDGILRGFSGDRFFGRGGFIPVCIWHIFCKIHYKIHKFMFKAIEKSTLFD